MARYLGQIHVPVFIFSNYLINYWLTHYIRKQTDKIASLPVPESRVTKDLHWHAYGRMQKKDLILTGFLQSKYNIEILESGK